MNWGKFLLFIVIGFAAQIIDGTLGMAYGVSCRTFLKTVAGLPSALASAVVHVAEVNYVMFSKEISPLSYLLSVLITVGFAVLVQIVMHRRLSRITMVESLKSVE